MTAQALLLCGLAAGWLLLPAVQYVGTVQRTRLQLGAPSERGSLVEALALLDLTPYYVLLLAATLLYGAMCALSARRRET